MAVTAPVLEIPINDAAVKRFFEAFQKYQGQLKEQPDTWKGINDAISGAAAVGAALASEIANQAEATQKLIAQEERRDNQAKKAAKRQHAEREAAIEQMKRYGKATLEAGKSLAKWTIGGGAVGAMGSALTLFGADRFARGVSGDVRTAGGLGVTPGQMISMQNNLQRYFDVNSTLAKIGEMRQDPTQQGLFRILGVGNAPGKSTAELTIEMARAAAGMYRASKGNVNLLSSQGVLNAFGLEDLRRLQDVSGFNQDVKKYRKNIGPSEISYQAGRSYQDLLQNLDNITAKLRSELIDKLSAFVSSPGFNSILTSLGKVSSAAIDAFAKFLSSPDVQKGMNDFAHTLESEDFQKGVRKFATNIEWAAEALSGLIDVLRKLINPTPEDFHDAMGQHSEYGDYLASLGKQVKGSVGGFFDRIVGQGEHGHMGQVSPKGAVGESQMLPGTAKMAAHKLGIPYNEAALYTDRNYNRALGKAWSDYLLKKYHGNEWLAAAAYNAGEGNVDRWLRSSDPAKRNIGSLEGHGAIPFAETRKYVERVMGVAAKTLQKKPASHYRHHKLKVENTPGSDHTVIANAARR